VADKILVIDDDPNVAELIKLILKPRGLLIYHAINGQEGLKQSYELQPDLIILDIMMPNKTGMKFRAALRELSDVPIVMLTAKSQSSDVTRGFAVGANDYVKKPFSNDELVSRIESLLRRKKSSDASTNITGYSDGTLEVDFATQKVTLLGEEVALTPTEFKLLAFLIRHPQKTLSTRTLLTEVWGNAYSHDKALLSLYIHQVRQKLKEEESDHPYIKTHWGQGYWFNPLPQAQKPVSIPEIAEQEQEGEEKVEPKTPTHTHILQNKWLWAVAGAFAGIFAFILFQQNIYLTFITNRDVGFTTIDAGVTAEGFRETEASGVRGEICIKNGGANPTENLSIQNTVQINSLSTAKNISGTVDVSNKPVLDPGESYCYPFEIAFEPASEQDAQYLATTLITITNYDGFTTGSKYCPPSRPCQYGPEITTNLILPEP
jgi:DNA-binding response OmpR family regulator